MSLKEKLLAVLSSVPLITLTTMSGACGASCPYGLSCSYPGQCGRFTDSGDGICDLSQSSSSRTSSNTETASSSSSYDPDTSTSTSTSSSKAATATQDQADQSSGVSSHEFNTSHDGNTSAIADPGSGVDSGTIPSDGTHYFLLPVSILLIGAYLFTYYLFSKGILDQRKHRRIWNLLVTAGYLGTGITGVLLILLINLGIKTALNPSVIFWHVELSILMVIGTIIHIHLYWKPFKNMFRVLFGFKTHEKKKEIGTRGTSK
ncbi:MAG: hypothetical protein HVN35_02390 [Methanobacteriaceae archaeon]|nr:hypothetical protein [Methanobacteriaceae archaeon]